MAAARTVTPFPLVRCCIPSFLPAVLASLRLCLATSMSVQRFFIAFGRVQQVMFRQTLMRAAIRRGLEAAASNSKISVRIIISSQQQRLLTCQSASSLQRDKVVFYLKGDDSKIVEIVDFLRAGKEMNNWGARVTRLDEITADEAARDPERARYQVTTSNVDDRQWDPNVEFYI